MSRVSDASAQQQQSHPSLPDVTPQNVKVENTHGAFGQNKAQVGPASREASAANPAHELRIESGRTPEASGSSTPAAITRLPPSTTAAFSEPASRTPSYHGHTNGHINAEAGPSRLLEQVKVESGEAVKDEKDGHQMPEEDQTLVKEAMRRKRRFAALQYGPEETAEMERRAVRNGLALALDQHATLFPSPPTRFTSYADAVDRLLPWHVWQIHDEELEGYLPDESGDTPEETARIQQQNEVKEKARVDKETTDAAALVHRIIGVRNRFVKVRRKEGFLPSLIQITRAQNADAHDELVAAGPKLRETRETHNRIDTENRRRQEAVRQAQMRETIRIEEEKRRLAALSRPAGPPPSTPATAVSASNPGPSTAPLPARPAPASSAPSSTPGPASKPVSAPKPSLTSTAPSSSSSVKPSPVAAPRSAPAQSQPSLATPAKPAVPPTPGSTVASPATPLTPGTPTAQRGRPRGRPRGTGRGGLRETTLTHSALAASGNAAAPSAPGASSSNSGPSPAHPSPSPSAGSAPVGVPITGSTPPVPQRPTPSAPPATGQSASTAPTTQSVAPQTAKPTAQAVQNISTPKPATAVSGTSAANGTATPANPLPSNAAGPSSTQSSSSATPGPARPTQGRITLTVSYENAHQLLKLGVLSKPNANGPGAPAPGMVTKVIAAERKMVLSIDLKQCSQAQVVGMAKIMNVQLPGGALQRPAGAGPAGGTSTTSASPVTTAGNTVPTPGHGSSVSDTKDA